jgi:oligopeptide/dipeptide ABC transporter ATP-binding protein
VDAETKQHFTEKKAFLSNAVESKNLQEASQVLSVQDLSVTYHTEKMRLKALDNVSFSLREREFVAIVGESGSGKSTLAFSIIGLLPPRAEVAGKIEYRNVELESLDKKRWNRIRGNQIGMIFQEPLSSLNPITKVGTQMWETLRKNASVNKREVKSYDYSAGRINFGRYHYMQSLVKRKIPSEAIEEIVYWLKLVRIPDPESIIEKYPFELSGGMIQRVMIAMVLSQRPSLLLADEPTTALDVTTQAQILKLFLNLRNVTNASVLLVTHDLGVAAHVADRVIVMYAGEIVEDGTKEQVFSNPLHPYTKALITCFPRGNKRKARLGSIPGIVPVMVSEINGCKFADRCGYVSMKCKNSKVNYVEVESKHFVRCTSYY